MSFRLTAQRPSSLPGPSYLPAPSQTWAAAPASRQGPPEGPMQPGGIDPGVAVARCVSDIEVADIVALDLEFSGLFLRMGRDSPPPALEEYFAKCLESVPRFLPLQLGVCCARQRPAPSPGAGGSACGAWELRSHEFNLWPGPGRRVFSADMESLKFLRQHGFDFNAFLEQAHPFVRLPQKAEAGGAEPGASKSDLGPPACATRVLEAMRRTRVPVVVHNGLLDLLHLYDKFVADLPGDSRAFGGAWLANFPLLFDTRLVAQEGRGRQFSMLGSSLTLEQLHRHLASLPELAVRFERCGPLDGARGAHGSSGYDATLTAEVFIMEVDAWLRHEDSQSRKRRRTSASAADAGACAGEGEGAAAGGSRGAGRWRRGGRRLDRGRRRAQEAPRRRPHRGARRARARLGGPAGEPPGVPAPPQPHRLRPSSGPARRTCTSRSSRAQVPGSFRALPAAEARRPRLERLRAGGCGPRPPTS
ncbi:unnamed protein product [Prorocentrum cordatum]|uniref:Uncharacterized protein n=1 Tax=Prorocentrum cordatum TaxID=2364126 RepID=A0ABN9RLV3_9DINO|nr:unnamed protein product [Polarella glacialis]